MIANTRANEPSTHHYIPIFYSKRWASGDPAKITRYYLWRPGQVSVDRKVPKGVGWENNGYSLEGFKGADAETVETQLMKPKDSQASRMLARLEANGADGEWNDKDRFAWTWFIVSLTVRGPQDVVSAKRNIVAEWSTPSERMEARYRNLLAKFPDLHGQVPSSLKDHIASMDPDYGKRLGVKIMADMTEHNEISTIIANMHWEIRRTRRPLFLLTSDRPVRRDYPLKSKNALITLPIGPHAVFVAANSREAIARAFRDGMEEFVKKNNRQLVRQARTFAIAYDDRDRNWVERNLAKDPQPGFFDFIRGAKA